ncbi:Hypothetical Protein FCC1311_110182 [Hondaea fermentalgiana]|uniref:PH domain-containing protein n=1 Tax=Hondaea fermentalgiana TaxID=2315210 RepID=A0A2R5GVC2_9STRA|nr:Hypothetical Protein FCC1311_110182 [Hondaea fermentalgiana]|eukprot:GBG34796.1 Hypothetical Protein FCC1311_110182 [Hondaea fermentalgiana]
MSVLHGGAPSELWSSPARSAPRARPSRNGGGNGRGQARDDDDDGDVGGGEGQQRDPSVRDWDDDVPNDEGRGNLNHATRKWTMAGRGGVRKSKEEDGIEDEMADEDDDDVLVLAAAASAGPRAPAAAATEVSEGLVMSDMLKIKTVSKDGLFGWAAITVELWRDRFHNTILVSKGLVLPRPSSAKTLDPDAQPETLLDDPEGKWSLRIDEIKDVQSFGGSACRFDLVFHAVDGRTAAFLAATPDTCQRWVTQLRALIHQHQYEKQQREHEAQSHQAESDFQNRDDRVQPTSSQSPIGQQLVGPQGEVDAFEEKSNAHTDTFPASAPDETYDTARPPRHPMGASASVIGLDNTWADESTIDGSILHAEIETTTAHALEREARESSPRQSPNSPGSVNDRANDFSPRQHETSAFVTDQDQDRTLTDVTFLDQEYRDPAQKINEPPRRKKRSTSRTGRTKVSTGLNASAPSLATRRRAKSATSRKPRHVAVDLNSSLHRPTRASIGQRHSGTVSQASPLHRRRRQDVASPKRSLRKRLNTTTDTMRTSRSRSVPRNASKLKTRSKSARPSATRKSPKTTAAVKPSITKDVSASTTVIPTAPLGHAPSRHRAAATASGASAAPAGTAKSPKKHKVTKREHALRERCKAQELELARLRYQLQTLVDGAAPPEPTRQLQDLQAQVESLRAERDAFERLYLQRGAKLEELQVQSELLMSKLEQYQRGAMTSEAAAANTGVGSGGGSSNKGPTATKRSKISASSKLGSKKTLASKAKKTTMTSRGLRRRNEPQWGH